jgi:hypothetical protein
MLLLYFAVALTAAATDTATAATAICIYTTYTAHTDEALPLWAQHAGFELMHTWQPVQLYNTSKNTNNKKNNNSDVSNDDVSSNVAPPPSVELHTGSALRYYGRFYRGGVRCALGPTGPKLKPPTAQYRYVCTEDMRVTVHALACSALQR